jgi:hypothetical protein
MNDSSIFTEEDVRGLRVLVHGFLVAHRVERALDIDVAQVFMVPDVLQVLSINTESLCVVRIDLAELVPKLFGLLSSLVHFLAKVIEYVEVRNDGGKMGPKLDLEVAHFLDGALHFTEEAFEFYDIGELGIHVLVVDVVLLNVLLNDVLVAEYSELLLERGLFLLCDVELDKRGMDVFHNLEKVEGEGDVDAGAVDELVQGVLIEALDEVVEEDLV